MRASLIIELAAGLALITGMAQAAISVTPTGTGWRTFDEPPHVSEWSTLFLSCCSSTISNQASLDAIVQTYAPSNIDAPLLTRATYPPNTSGQNGAFWNSTAHVLETRPAGGGKGILLMATLRNDTGSALSAAGLSFGMGLPITNYWAGEVPGYSVYFSLTSETNGWRSIPELSGLVTNGDISVVLSVGSWGAGAPLYILFADDNADGITDWPYTIDNFAVAPFPIVIEPPRLFVEQAAPEYVQLSWQVPATGYLLQSTTDLNLMTWRVGVGPQFVHPTNGIHRVQLPSGENGAYFQLWKP